VRLIVRGRTKSKLSQTRKVQSGWLEKVGELVEGPIEDRDAFRDRAQASAKWLEPRAGKRVVKARRRCMSPFLWGYIAR